MRILSRYILRETLVPLVLGFILFSSLIMLERVLKLISLIMEKDLPLELAGRLLLLYFPFTMPLTIPMALLMAILMAFGRLAADNEILVLRACGYNIARLAVPVIMLGLLLSVATLAISDTIATHSFALYKELLYQITQRSQIIAIQPKVDLNLNTHKLYVDAANNDEQTMQGIRLNELSGDRRTIYAQTGRWYREGDMALVFSLYNGSIHSAAPDGAYYTMPFGEFKFRVELGGQLLGTREANRAELSLRELRAKQLAAQAAGEDAAPFAVEFHRRLALPFACLAFACSAVPLGMMARRSGRSVGFGLSLVLIFGYYLLVIGGEPLALRGTLPAPAMWTANLLFIAAGLWGLQRQTRQ
ncbi:MAG TPA: LptF/LptG family permease [bacterium]|nr:LptF/LptG family permease [bacterium]